MQYPSSQKCQLSIVDHQSLFPKFQLYGLLINTLSLLSTEANSRFNSLTHFFYHGYPSVLSILLIQEHCSFGFIIVLFLPLNKAQICLCMNTMANITFGNALFFLICSFHYKKQDPAMENKILKDNAFRSLSVYLITFVCLCILNIWILESWLLIADTCFL